jgi:hypothetical protein
MKKEEKIIKPKYSIDISIREYYRRHIIFFERKLKEYKNSIERNVNMNESVLKEMKIIEEVLRQEKLKKILE